MDRAKAACAAGMGHLPLAALPEIDANLGKCLTMFATQTAFTISSCRLPDMPIMYASPHFCSMTGYSAREVVGRNCRFLQGPGTSRQAVLEIRDSIQEDRGCTVCMLNYTKDHKPFWNQLCLSPITDQHGVAYYLGIQTNVTGAVLAYRSQMYSPFNTNPGGGPHGGVHSFEGCSDIVAKEEQIAQQMSTRIQRWHSERLSDDVVPRKDFRPVSSALLPASLLGPLYKLQQSFCLADPNMPDMPIVHASEGFLRLTGRPRHEVVGHNCRFMQGKGTDPEELERLRQAIAEERPVTVSLMNFKHDGSPFWNHLHVAPIRNADGKVVFFVGVQLDITKPPASAAVEEPSSTPEVPDNRQLSGPSAPVDILASLSLSHHPQIDLTGPCAADTIVSKGSEPPKSRSQTLEAESCCGVSSQQVEPREAIGPKEKQMQRSVVGTVRVVCRSLSAKSGLRRSSHDQHRPHAADLELLEKSGEMVSRPTRLDTPTLCSSHI